MRSTSGLKDLAEPLLAPGLATARQGGGRPTDRGGRAKSRISTRRVLAGVVSECRADPAAVKGWAMAISRHHLSAVRDPWVRPARSPWSRRQLSCALPPARRIWPNRYRQGNGATSTVGAAVVSHAAEARRGSCRSSTGAMPRPSDGSLQSCSRPSHRRSIHPPPRGVKCIAHSLYFTRTATHGVRPDGSQGCVPPPLLLRVTNLM